MWFSLVTEFFFSSVLLSITVKSFYSDKKTERVDNFTLLLAPPRFIDAG